MNYRIQCSFNTDELGFYSWKVLQCRHVWIFNDPSTVAVVVQWSFYSSPPPTPPPPTALIYLPMEVLSLWKLRASDLCLTSLVSLETPSRSTQISSVRQCRVKTCQEKWYIACSMRCFLLVFCLFCFWAVEEFLKDWNCSVLPNLIWQRVPLCGVANTLTPQRDIQSWLTFTLNHCNNHEWQAFLIR